MAKKYQPHIYMPNEIFQDLRTNIEKIQHVVFAYSFIYFISHLYRHCEYEGMTQAVIKKNLRYNANEKRLDYLIKKDGLLDRIGYTQTTNEFPLSWEMDEDNIVHFQTVSSSIITDRNFKVKYPIKLFHRTEKSLQDQMLDGTIYDVSNSHKVNFKAFNKCMENDKLGVTAFYIYGYLRWKNDMFGDYRVASRKLAEEIGISEPTLFKYLKEMETKENKLVKITHKKFIGVGGEANLYRALV